MKTTGLEELKQRAKAGDRDALNELRARGFFAQKKHERKGYPASHAQERLWLLDRLHDELTAYNMPGQILLEGAFDTNVFWSALRHIVMRHESLRTTLAQVDGELRQFVHPQPSVSQTNIDLSRHDDPMREALAYAMREAAAPFDLKTGPLFRAAVLHLAKDRRVLLFNFHHIICDEWSLDILLRELTHTYNRFIQHQEPDLPPLPIQYKDFAAWQLKQLTGEPAKEAKAFWHKKLEGTLQRLDLPYDYPRPPVQTQTGKTITQPLNNIALQSLIEDGRRREARLFVTVMALVKAFLQRYTGQTDIAVGSPFAGRTHPDLENLIGFFVNTVCLRDTISGSDSFVDVLQKIRVTVSDAVTYQDYPFDLLVNDLLRGRDPGRTPFFDVMVVVQPAGHGAFQLGEAAATALECGFDSAKFDLTFDFTESPDGMLFRLNYNADLFQAETIRRMGNHFNRFLEAVAAAPQTPICQHPIVTDKEAECILHQWNEPTSRYPQEETVISLFEQQARLTPDRIALTAGERHLSYHELNRLADRIAAGIIAEAVQPEERVGLLLDRSEWMVAAILAVQKAGCVYVPIDPQYPADRIDYMLEDCGARLVLTEESFRHTLTLSGSNRRCLNVKNIPTETPSVVRRVAHPNTPLYVIYTSGSTGRPKGCVITHRNVVRLMINNRHPFRFDKSDVWIAAHSFCFDFSVWEMYGALLYGGRLIIQPRRDVQDIESFYRLLRRHRVSVLNQTPAAFYNLIAYESSLDEPVLHEHLRYVILGGDRLQPTYLAPWVKRYPLSTVKLVNMYGITETTVHVTYYEIQANDVSGPAGRSPIGKPIPGTTVFVCNQGLQLQPPGIAGELLVGGEGVGRGYLNQPELTDERFIHNPFQPDGRLYRSGDLGKYTPDGSLEHLGRNDDQVQVRGYRIELGEIESAVLRYPEVDKCVVLAKGDSPETQRLTAYVSIRPGADHHAKIEQELKQTARAFLPDYMVPSSFILIDAFPLTANGKIDRKRLLDITPAPPSLTHSHREPLSPTEVYLLELWRDLLKRDDVNRDGNFFELGGHSLSAASMVARIHRERQIKIPLRTVFQYPKLADLAQAVDAGRAIRLEGITPAPRAERYALSPAQRRLWLIERMGANPLAYIISEAFYTAADFDPAAFHAAVERVIERHESLRTALMEEQDEAWQVVLPSMAAPIEVIEIPDETATDEMLDHRLQEHADRPFDLTAAPLFRITIFMRPNRPAVVLVSMHHIISDGWSMQILIREIEEIYRAVRRGIEERLPTLSLQYKDYAAWQNRMLESEAALESRRFWLDRFADEIPVLDLPADRPRPPVQSFAGETYTFEIEAQQAQQLFTLGRGHGASPFMTMLALVNVLLYRYTGQNDILIGSPVAGREHPDLEPLVGFFVNTVAIRTLLDGSKGFSALLQEVRESVSQALQHQSYPFDRLVEELHLQRDVSRSPLFDVAVTLQKEADRTAGELAADALAFQPKISKFDLTFFFTETARGTCTVGIEYSTDLFNRERIVRMSTHLSTLLHAVMDAPHEAVNRLPFLSQNELELLETFNHTRRDYPKHSTVASRFEQMAATDPDRTALHFGEISFSYRDVNRLSNGLAFDLKETYGIQLEECVGVLFERSQWTVIAPLAVLKAGAAYVPLDPAYPVSRIGYMMQDADCRVVLTDSKRLAQYQRQFPQITFIDIQNACTKRNDNPHPPNASPSLAYVMYTSGSTGLPKGTLIEQHSILRLVLNTHYIKIGCEDCIIQTGSLSFDASTFEIWGALLNGACVCLPEEGELLDPGRLKRLLQQRRVSVMFLTTSLFNQFVDADIDLFAHLRVLLTGGEKVSVKHINRVRRRFPKLDLLHVYGPTENTTFSTFHRVMHEYEDDVPIGAPIANSTLWILDKHRNLQPVGVPGEICTGGDGVARGYLNRPERTQQAFIPHPFIPGERLYRTGDLGRWNADGSVSFLGRIDHQVKVRGFRVEPGEIEQRLSALDAIDRAAVVPRQTTAGTLELIAYCSGNARLNEHDIRHALSEQLPDHMIPSRFVFLDELPLNPNGKIDRRKLPEPDDNTPAADTPPRNETEQVLIEVWESVLSRRGIGIHDNYFELGGDSIRAIQMISRLQRRGWKIEIRDLFQYLTIAELAPRLTSSSGSAESNDVVEGAVPFTPIQCWFFEHPTDDIHHFNQAVMLQLSRRVNAESMKQAAGSLWNHHDALRMQFHQSRGRYEQYNRGLDLPPEVECVDVRACENEEQAIADHADRAQASFDLQNTPLFKAILYHKSDGDRLLLMAHHLVVDGVSWRIIIEDLERVYLQHEAGQPLSLGPKSASYRQWAKALQTAAHHESILRETSYWREALSQSASNLCSPEAIPSMTYGRCGAVQQSLSPEETQALFKEPHRAFYTEVHELLLAALSRTLHQWLGHRSYWIMLEGHGREDLPIEMDVTRTVGWFTSMYPFRLHLQEGGLREQLLGIKESLRQVPRKGLGYGLLRYLAKEDIQHEWHDVQPQISFNYLGHFDADEADSLFTISDADTGRTIGKRVSRAFALDVIAVSTGGRMQLSILFDSSLYRRAEIESMLLQWKTEVHAIVEYCRQRAQPEKTPADFTSPVFSLETYTAFLQSQGWKSTEIEEVYALTPMQEGLLFQSLYQPDSPAYFLQTSFRLLGNLSIEAFRQAWLTLVERHAVFRTAFVYENTPQPLQVVFRSRPPEWSVETCTDSEEAAFDQRLLEYQEADRTRGFHLTRDPLMRIQLFQQTPNAVDVIWSYHHLLMDGWCLRIVYEELLHLYIAFRDSRPPQLKPAPRFSEYIGWLQGQNRQTVQEYWKRYLEGYDSASYMIPQTRRRMNRDFVFRHAVLEVDRVQTEAVYQTARQANVTVNVMVQAALAAVLVQYNDRDDIVFGAIGSGRSAPLPGIEDMVGLLIHAVPVRIQIHEKETIAAWLQRIQAQSIESETHALISPADIRAAAGLEGDLFDVLMVFANYPTELTDVLAQGGEAPWQVERLHTFDQTHYDFTLVVVPGERLTLRFHYNAARFTEQQIHRIQTRFANAIEHLTRDLHAPAATCLELPPDERDTVLYRFNQTRYPIESDRTVLHDFQDAVAAHADCTAVRFGSRSFTYAELDAASNQLAHELIERHGIQPDDLVCVYMQRSEWLPVAVWGIIKAGGAYVPIDPGAPAARIEHILQDSGCRVMVTHSQDLNRFQQEGIARICADRLDNTSSALPEVQPKPGHAVYVIYTSGTTGLPKGCILEHRNLYHYLHWAKRFYFSNRGGTMALHSSISMDMTVTSLYLPLLLGNTLHVFPQEMEVPDMLQRMFEPGSPFDCVKLTPSHIAVLNELDLSSTHVRSAIVGGEALPIEAVRTLHRLNPKMRVINEYGPTETTVGCVVDEVSGRDENVLIGKPIDNTRIYILDRNMKPVPIGASGEMVIGGAGVARGYHRRDDLTRQRFVPDPFEPGQTVYRTGDIAVWCEDGRIDYLGRNDDQIKVRGHRVELKEIEHGILAIEGIEQVAVIQLKQEPYQDQLAAYYTSKKPLAVESLRPALHKTLPEYSRPTFWIRMESLPLSSSGKVDHRALPVPPGEDQSGLPAPREPQSETERILVRIFTEVLNQNDLGIDSRFFEYGGHSLKAMQAVSRIHKRLGVKLSLRDLFNHPTAAELAALVQKRERVRYEAIQAAPKQDRYEVSFAQKRLWLIQQIGGIESRTAYNMPKALRLDGALDVDALARAYQRLIERHEALRTSFVEEDGVPKQVIYKNCAAVMEPVDLSADPDAEEQARTRVEADAHTPFDLTQPPLLRAMLLQLAEQRYVFSLTINHIIGDGWSMVVLFRDLLHLYDTETGKREAPPPLRIQYKDFAHWQMQLDLSAHEHYWLSELKGKPESIPLPYDRPPTTERAYQGATLGTSLDPHTVHALRQWAQTQHTTLSTLILSLFYVLLYQWTKQSDLCIGVSHANRNHPDLEGLTGFFVNLLPVRVHVDDRMELEPFIDSLAQRLNDACEHQDYPFDLLVQKLNPHRQSTRQPLVNVVYGYQNFADIHPDGTHKRQNASTESNPIRIEEFDLGFHTSKFDLTLFVSENKTSLDFNLEYDVALFDKSTIQTLAEALAHFARSAVEGMKEKTA